MTNINTITYNALYPDGTFKKVSLGKVINRGGAAGRIYEIERQPYSYLLKA